MKLAGRFALFAALLALVGLPALGLWAWLTARDTVIQLLRREQTALAGNVLSQLDRTLSDDLQEILLIGSHSHYAEPRAELPFLSGAEAEASRLDDMALLTGPWDDLVLAGPDGRVLAATDRSRTGAALTDPAEREALEASLRGEVFASEVVEPAGAVRPTMIFSAPVREGRGPGERVTGVVVGRVGWPAILEILDEVDPRIDAWLLDGANRIVGARTEHRDQLLRTIPPVREGEIRAATNHPEAGLVLVTVARQKGYLGFRSRGWVLVLETPISAASSQMRKAALRIAAQGAALFLLTLGALTFLVRRAVRPLEAISAAARRLGDGDLSVRTSASGRDEVGDLGTAFDRMADQLGTSMREIRRQATLLESIVESMAEGVIVAGADGRFLVFNEAARALTGSEGQAGSPSESSEDLSRLMKPDGVTPYPLDELPLARAIRGEATQNVEVVIVEAGGTAGRVLSVSGRPLRVADGAPAGGVIVFRDVSAERETEAKLRRAKANAEETARMKSQFLASMSHEIRTPLNGVIGMTGILLDSGLTPQQRDYAETVRSSGEALLAIVNDVLDITRLESGQLALEDVPFDPAVVVEEVTANLAPASRKKYLDLVVRLAPSVPRQVRGDPGRLRQVLLNLVGNAVKFTFEGWVLLDVSCSEQNGDTALLKVRVEDTGLGVTEEQIPRLFDRFTQADAGTARRFGGTGLGLAISRQLVELLGGTIGAEPRPGGGSVFWFTVPLAVVSMPPEPKPALGDLAGARVLIVDDHDVNRLVLAELLASWGLRNEKASSGEEALALLREAREAGDPFGVVLLDIVMPGMDGTETARAIRDDPELAGLVVVAVSSVDPPAASTPGGSGPFDRWTMKPVRPSRLLDAMASAFRARHGGTELQAAPAPKLEADTPSAPGSAYPGVCVLVVDDSWVNQKVAALQLEKLGCRVELAENGHEAVKAVSRSRFDLVLMDCQMPEMDGYAATREIRRLEPPGQRLPIVAATAHALPGEREKCLAAGMDDHLAKPIRPADLERALRRWLGPPVAPLPAIPPANAGLNTAPLPAVPPAGEEPEAATDGTSAARAAAEIVRYLGEVTGDRERASEVAGLFVTGALESVGALRQATEDAPAFARAAHKLKGSAGSVGAASVAALAAALEEMGGSGSQRDAERLAAVSELESHLTDLRTALRAALERRQE